MFDPLDRTQESDLYELVMEQETSEQADIIIGTVGYALQLPVWQLNQLWALRWFRDNVVRAEVAA